jgi:hypothetical protein
MDRLVSKIRKILTSRRVYAAITALLAALFQETLGLTEEAATQIVVVLLSWILSDSISHTGPAEAVTLPQKTQALAGSVRFWTMIATIAGSLWAGIPDALAAVSSTYIIGRGISKRDMR